MRSLVVGNWKMNGSLASAKELIHALSTTIDDKIRANVGICVPYVFLPLAQEKLSNSSIRFGAQNVASYSEGAYTGEVSASMLKDFDASWVIIGHSERRQLFDETTSMLLEKVKQAQAVGIRPIFCVGETLEKRQQGEERYVIEQQLEPLLADKLIDLDQLVIAYEPVWAIGTGMTASKEQAQEMHAFIRKLVAEQSTSSAENMSILYGGSVKGDNAKALFEQKDIDGGLIGGASLDAKEFATICQMA